MQMRYLFLLLRAFENLEWFANIRRQILGRLSNLNRRLVQVFFGLQHDIEFLYDFGLLNFLCLEHFRLSLALKTVVRLCFFKVPRAFVLFFNFKLRCKLHQHRLYIRILNRATLCFVDWTNNATAKILFSHSDVRGSKHVRESIGSVMLLLLRVTVTFLLWTDDNLSTRCLILSLLLESRLHLMSFDKWRLSVMLFRDFTHAAFRYGQLRHAACDLWKFCLLIR